MSIAVLIRDIAAAGAPPEAIAITVEAIEPGLLRVRAEHTHPERQSCRPPFRVSGRPAASAANANAPMVAIDDPAAIMAITTIVIATIIATSTVVMATVPVVVTIVTAVMPLRVGDPAEADGCGEHSSGGDEYLHLHNLSSFRPRDGWPDTHTICHCS